MINQNNKTIQEKFDNDNDEINELIENKGGHDEETQKKVKHLKNIIKKLESGLAITENDLIEKNDIKEHDFDSSIETEDDIISLDKKETKDYTPSEAQKQTYKLIDTVKQLDSTIKTLAPTLEIGKKVLDKMKEYKL